MTVPSAAGAASGRAARTYLSQEVKEALAKDPRVGELDLQVRVDDEQIFVTGHVTTEERRKAVSEIVGRMAPGMGVRNDLTVVDSKQPPVEERLE